MILKLGQIKPLLQALIALDGTPPFKFSAKVTWNKTKNMRILRERDEKLEIDRNELVKKFCLEGEKQVPQERVPEFMEAFSEMLKSEEDIQGLLTIDFAGLNLFDPESNPNGNVIPSSVLEAVMPLLTDPCDG